MARKKETNITVALDARRVRNHSAGVGHYVTKIVDELIRQQIRCVLFLPQNEKQLPYQTNAQIKIERVPERIDVCWERYYTEQHVFPRLLQKHHVDIYHATDSMGVPFLDIPTVLTVHDLIPWVTGEYLNSWKKILYRHAIRLAVRRAQHILAISQHTKRELQEYVQVESERIQVIYNGYSVAPFGKNISIPFFVPKRYIIYVGGLGPRKNIPNMLRAYAQFAGDHKEPPTLVMVGVLKKENDKEIHSVISELGIQKNIIFTGFIDDAQLAFLRSRALFALYVSTYEGFGLPIIEAMAQGVPVITSTVTAMPEVAGGAALLVDPASVEDIAAKMSLLYTDLDLHGELVEKGLHSAQDFSWEKTVAQIIEVYRRALNRPLHRPS